jgi:hypothetical protein
LKPKKFFLLEAKKEFTALRGVPERHREEEKKAN